jgi:hypothetical protein
LVIVVRDRVPTWAVILVILLILVAVAVLVFAITGGAGTILVVAIPGFPIESILIGLALGLLWAMMRHRSKPSQQEHRRHFSAANVLVKRSPLEPVCRS